MKKDSNEPVKLDGKVEGLKKYIHSGRNHVTFKVNNKQVTIDTGSSPMFIENGDDVIAVGMTDSVGNMAPHIFSNKSRNIDIQKFSLKAGKRFMVFLCLLGFIFLAWPAYLLFDDLSLDNLGPSITFTLLSTFLFFWAKNVYREMRSCKKMLSMLKS